MITYAEARAIDELLIDRTPRLCVGNPLSAYSEYPTPRRPAEGGYIAYVPQEAPSNAAGWRPGWGRTPTEAGRCALFWANQGPYVRVVRAAAAPKWVVRMLQEEAP